MNQQGFTYLSLMFSVTLIGITLAGVAQPWKTILQREREADLLAHGIEIQSAIGAYSTRLKAGRVMQGEFYPQSLEDLTRQPKPLLRKVYQDPITKGTFELVRAPTGGIMGVRSRSDAKPLRQHEFPAAVRHFDGMKQYRDWVFQHPNASGSTVPIQSIPAPYPGGPVSTGGTVPPGVLLSPQSSGQNLPGFQSGVPPSSPVDTPQSSLPPADSPVGTPPSAP